VASTFIKRRGGDEAEKEAKPGEVH
jgi:hypothetical protein